MVTRERESGMYLRFLRSDTDPAGKASDPQDSILSEREFVLLKLSNLLLE